MSDNLPQLAISVRQPWAWAIIHVGKDVENRVRRAISFMVPLKGRRAIHASKGMTREEYYEAYAFMRGIGIVCPNPAELQRGGIIGSVMVTGAVKSSDSRCFFGPWALTLADPQPCDLVPAVGQLGYFKWKPGTATVDTPRWMRPTQPPVANESAARPDRAPDLFDEARR